jgi:uncharacterized membrane protein
MVKFQNREFFFGLLIIIAITDICVLLDISLFRQIFSFVFISLIPGIIILRGLKLNKLGTANTLVFGVGLSVFFIMGFGLIVNTILPFLGYGSPLSMISLLIFFNILVIILLILGYLQNSREEITIQIPTFNRIDKICLILAFSLPVVGMSGLYMMNQFNENLLLLLLFFFIAFLTGFIAVKRTILSPSLYPLVIFLISISLILLFPLRSLHVADVDPNLEYFFFQNTFGQLHWTILQHGLLDACLSISLLPTVYTSLLGLNPEFVFKIFSPLLFSITPVVVYLIAKKYVDPIYAFLASVFFMSQANFIVAGSIARTSLAVLFISLIILSLFSDEIDKFNKGVLTISFILGCIFSHYSSAYILFIVIFTTFIITYIFSIRYRITRNLYFYFIIVFFCALYLWYSMVIEGPFTQAVQFIGQIIVFGSSHYAPELGQLAGRNLSLPVISVTNLFIKLLTFFFIGYGVLSGLILWLKQNKKLPVNHVEHDIVNLDIEFIILGLISGFILFLTVILPFISVGYDINRIYLLISVVLATYFIIGGKVLVEQLNFFVRKIFRTNNLPMNKKNLSPVPIISFIVIINFLFSMSVPHQLVGDDSSVFFNSQGDLYNRMFVHDQDVSGAIWIKEYKEKELNIYSDVYSEKVLQSQAEISETNRIPELSAGQLFESGYLFTIYYNNINMRIINEWDVQKPDLSPQYNQMVNDLNKIYTNYGSVIWSA